MVCTEIKSIKRVVGVWSRDLCHINKTRDNRVICLSSIFDFKLFIGEEAKVGQHIYESEVVLCKSKKKYVSYIYFIWHVIINRKTIDYLWCPIGEELIVILVARVTGVAVLMDLWDVPAITVRPGKVRKAIFYLYRCLVKMLVPDNVIVLTGVMKEGVDSYVGRDSSVIELRNGLGQEFLELSNNLTSVDYSFYKRDGDMDDVGSIGGISHIKLLYLGVVHPTRGLDLIIKGVNSLKDIGYCHVTVTFCGPTDQDTKQFIDKYSDEDLSSVVFKEVKSTEVIAEIQSHDICLCTLSDIEKYRYSYPVKVMEYLSVGKPVVASNLPALSQMAQKTSLIYLYEPDSQSSFNDVMLECIERVSDHCNQRIDERTLKYVNESSWCVVCKKIQELVYEK